MSKKLYMLVGLPCVGKTTWKDKFLVNAHKDFMTLSTDQYIECWASGENISYSESFDKHYNTAERAMRANFYRAIKTGMSIIWDQTNLTKSSRRYKLKNIPDDYEKICVFFETPRDYDILRKKTRIDALGVVKNIDDKVITRMKLALQVPSIDEGFSQIIVVRNAISNHTVQGLDVA